MSEKPRLPGFPVLRTHDEGTRRPGGSHPVEQRPQLGLVVAARRANLRARSPSRRHRDHAGGQHASRACGLYPSRSRAPQPDDRGRAPTRAGARRRPRPVTERRASRRAAYARRRQPALVVPVPGGRGRARPARRRSPRSAAPERLEVHQARVVQGDGDAERAALPARRRRARRSSAAAPPGRPGRRRPDPRDRSGAGLRARPVPIMLSRVTSAASSSSLRPSLPRGAAGRPGSAPRSWSPRPGSRSRREARHRTRGAPPAAPRPPARGRPGSCTSSAAGRAGHG